MAKLLVFGLDCATPQLLFDAWLDDLPNLKRLVDRGIAGPLRSTLPPITVPAWTAMMTSKDPGMLGFYGFRNRKSYDYENLYFANAKYVKAKTLWNYLSRNRKKSLIFGIPQTFPPKPLNGIMVASFLTPNKDVQFTYPDDIKAELDQAAGGDYMIDVKDFRTDDKNRLLSSIHEMSRRRFKAFRHFYSKEEYDFAMLVEMGIDRIHHGFWRYTDKTHRLYEPGNEYENCIKDYYQALDEEIGKTLEIVDEDTSIMVVSDHGAKTMVGAICVNEWLQQKGWLTLKEEPTEQKRLSMDMVDWSKTKAWGEGGYYCRLFLNVEGREPYGQIPNDEYESFRDEVKEALENIADEEGNCIGTRVFKPEEVYREVKNIPPDLIVYFGNLDWRSAGSVGVGSVHMYENDTGPDDANHAEHGVFILARADGSKPAERDEYSIYDIAPTVLTHFGLDVPDDMIGRSIL